MSVEDLKTINPAGAALLAQARSEHEQAGHALAVLETDAAAQLFRHLLGEQATSVLLDKEEYDNGTARITVLVVFDENDEPIWVNTEEVEDYPGADDLSDADLDALPTNWRIEDHLERAYDLWDGAGPPMDVTTDDHFTNDRNRNLLLLNIDAALS